MPTANEYPVGIATNFGKNIGLTIAGLAQDKHSHNRTRDGSVTAMSQRRRTRQRHGDVTAMSRRRRTRQQIPTNHSNEQGTTANRKPGGKRGEPAG
jgi:hypothetical protein